MIKEVIDSIIEAERKAEEILQDAYAKSKEIIAGAEAERITVANKGRELSKSRVKAIIDAGESAAGDAAAEVLKAGEAEGAAMFEEGMKKSAEARNYIVRRIISKYGTR